MTRNQANALMVAILETVAETPKPGAPSGIIYAALNAAGITLSQYMTLQSALVGGGLCESANDCLTITDRGRAIVADITAARAVA